MPVSAAQEGLKGFEFSEHAPHEGDGIQSFFRPAAVRGAPLRHNLRPGEASVRGNNVKACGLHHDGPICERAGFEQGASTQALELFVRHGGDDYVSLKLWSLGELFDGNERCRQASLHVLSTTSIEAIALHPRREGIFHSVNSDSIQVPIKHKASSGPGPL